MSHLLPKRHFSLWKYFLFDVLAVGLLFFLGLFLISYYANYDYLHTGYQDWMFHAFRVQSLQQHGFVSWDHIWSNGINYWRGYQYIPHLAALAISKIFSFNPTRSMAVVVVLVFVAIRLSMYAFLRKLGTSPLIALLATCLSYAFIQQWVTIKDYSLFVGLIVWPGFIFLWIQTLKKQSLIYLISVIAGAMWGLHPILGYSATALMVISWFFSSQKNHWKQVALAASLFLVCSASFWVPYFFYGYSYKNPILSFAQFLKQTLVKEYYGLSILYWGSIALSWFIIFIQTGRTERWSKLLLLSMSMYIVTIFVAQGGYLPNFINQLQVSRAMVVIAFTLPFVFAHCFEVMYKQIGSRFLLGMIGVLIALTMTQSVEISNRYTAVPRATLTDPVAIFFKNNQPEGSIFYENISPASYFNPKLRFVISYNEHMEPHPLSQRFRKLLKSDLSYTGVSGTQLGLINDYSKVLGVQYIFLPHFSSMITDLSDKDRKSTIFTVAGEADSDDDKLGVLKSILPIQYAFLGDDEVLHQRVSFELLKKPTLHADTFQPWDYEVGRTRELIESSDVQPLKMEFIDTDTLKVTLPEKEIPEHIAVMVMQSYDNNWKVSNVPGASIEPTALRMMYVKLPSNFIGKELILKNSWPVWYWPFQAISFFVFIFVSFLYLFDGLFNTKKNEEVVKTEIKTELKQ